MDRSLTVATADLRHATESVPRALFELKDVSVGNRLQEVSADIPLGVTAVLGPSGAGKSTFLDLLCGAVQPSRRRFVGTAAPSTSTSQLPLLWAGCGEGLWAHLSAAGQILAVGADPADWLPRFELDGRSDVKPSAMSQGERARLELARALAADPATLILDEPLTHVDRRRASRGWEEIASWTRREGRNLIFSTHDLAAAHRLATHVVCLDGGRVVDNGPLDRVLTAPSCEAAAWAVGAEGVTA